MVTKQKIQSFFKTNGNDVYEMSWDAMDDFIDDIILHYEEDYCNKKNVDFLIAVDSSDFENDCDIFINLKDVPKFSNSNGECTFVDTTIFYDSEGNKLEYDDVLNLKNNTSEFSINLQMQGLHDILLENDVKHKIVFDIEMAMYSLLEDINNTEEVIEMFRTSEKFSDDFINQYCKMVICE